VKVRCCHFTPEREIIGAVLSKSGSGIAQLLISTTSWVGLFKILAMFGSTALAGYTIAIRIVTFALMPAWGLANAGATLVGQNLGAGKPERAEEAVKIAMKLNVIVLGIVGIGFVLFAGPLIHLFNPESDVAAFGAQSLWIVSLAFPLYAAGMCFEAAFNGSGDTWTPARLNFMCLWVGQIPIAWFLSKTLSFGPVGAVISVPAAYSLLALWSWALFKRGKWKTQKV
jgi:Na+-driven multidrug efflux pump